MNSGTAWNKDLGRNSLPTVRRCQLCAQVLMVQSDSHSWLQAGLANGIWTCRAFGDNSHCNVNRGSGQVLVRK